MVEDKNRSVIVSMDSSFFRNPVDESKYRSRESKPESPFSLKVPKESAKGASERLLAALAELENGRGHLSAADLEARKRGVLDRAVDEIGELDPVLGAVLRKTREEGKAGTATLQREVEQARSEAVREKHRADKLEKENIDLTHEYERQSALIDSQKILIKDLKRQQPRETTSVSASSEKMENLSSEIKMMCKENGRLEALAKRLQNDLRQSRLREATLTTLLKSTPAPIRMGAKENAGADRSFDVNVLAESKASLNKTELRLPQKKRVMVPPLDFSRLPQRKVANLTVVQVQCDSASSASLSDSAEASENGKAIEVEVAPADKSKEEILEAASGSQSLLDKAIDNLDDMSSSWRDVLKDK